MNKLIFLFLLLCPSFYYAGAELRTAQEKFFQLSIMALLSCSLFFKQKAVERININKWVGIFGLWVMYLYVFYMFKLGNQFLLNLFYGTLLYLICYKTLEKKDIPMLFKAVIWVSVMNMAIMLMQMNGYSPVFSMKDHPGVTDPFGLFGLKASLGVYLACAMPLIACINWWMAGLLLLPIGLTLSTGALAGGTLAWLFFLWFKKRLAFWIIAPLCLIGCVVYFVKADMPTGMVGTRLPMWKMVLKDTLQNRPLLGFGLDSFREGNLRYFKDPNSNETIQAKQIAPNIFSALVSPDSKMNPNKPMDYWDDPHNLILSLLFQAGIPALVFIFIFLRLFWYRFKSSVKTNEVVAIAGVFIVILVSSMTQFPMFLARNGHLVPVMLSLFMIETEG